MSDEARERLLHVALEEELGGAKPPDLTLRLLSAVRRAERQTGWTARLLPRAPRRKALAAAAVLVVGIAAGFYLLRPAPITPELLVTSDVPLLTVSPTGPTRHDVRFGPGTVVHAGLEPARLAFPGGIEVLLEPRAFVRIGGTSERPTLAYGSGTVSVRGGSVPLSIELREGTVQVVSSTEILLERVADPDTDGPEEDDDVFWVADERLRGGSSALAMEPGAEPGTDG